MNESTIRGTELHWGQCLGFFLVPQQTRHQMRTAVNDESVHSPLTHSTAVFLCSNKSRSYPVFNLHTSAYGYMSSLQNKSTQSFPETAHAKPLKSLLPFTEKNSTIPVCLRQAQSRLCFTTRDVFIIVSASRSRVRDGLRKHLVTWCHWATGIPWGCRQHSKTH